MEEQWVRGKLVSAVKKAQWSVNDLSLPKYLLWKTGRFKTWNKIKD